MSSRYPPPSYHFRYEQLPTSGNIINGVGNHEKVKPLQIFHSSGFRRVEWEALELFFLLTMPLKLFLKGMYSRWVLRNADGKVARQRRQVKDLPAMSAEIKNRAIALGAGAVGITTLPEHAQYQDVNKPYKFAVSIACPMDFEVMDEHVADAQGGLETLRAYTETTRIAVKLAATIRSMGWPARAYCESSDILHIPIAINAGVGELGKHGSLINREMGSSFRLATVLTDLPLMLDEPVDIGVDDLCIGCRRCTLDCPADAITDSKQMVRGFEKWYVDFDRCVPYFSITYGCGICIQVCPWSKPGRGPRLSETLLAKRAG